MNAQAISAKPIVLNPARLCQGLPLALRCVIVLGLLAASPLVAQSSVELKGSVLLEKTVVEDGRSHIELVAPHTVVPGDPLVFRTDFTNRTGEIVTNFVVTSPLPDAVLLDGEGAAGLTVSIDEGKNWGTLASLRLPDGAGGSRPATSDDVTHVRWTIAQIEPGQTGHVTYRAKVR